MLAVFRGFALPFPIRPRPLQEQSLKLFKARAIVVLGVIEYQSRQPEREGEIALSTTLN